MKISELKKEAITKLTGKWGLAVGVGIVYAIFYAVLQMILDFVFQNASEGVLAIISFILDILLIPFSYGILVSMIRLSRNENVGVMDFISTGLRNFGKVIKLNIVMVLKLWLPILLLIVSVLLLGFAFYQVSDSAITAETLPNVSSSPELVPALIITAIVIELVAVSIMIVKTLSFSLSSYLLFDNPEATSNEIINTSVRLMKGYKFKFVLLDFSFIGWIFLLLFTFVIAAAIVPTFSIIVLLAGISILAPYISFTTISFYETLKNNNDTEAPIAE